MDKIRDKVNKNIEKYKGCPFLANSYYTNSKCILCNKIAIESAFKTESNTKLEEISKTNLLEEANKNLNTSETLDNSHMSYTASTKIMLKKHGLSVFNRLNNEKITRKRVMNEKTQIEIYQDFLNIIDISTAKSAFKTIDLTVFNLFFQFKFTDSVIKQFITKLENDPLMYSKEDKTNVFYILILAVTYCHKNNIDYKKLLKKIQEINFLFKPNLIFNVEYLNNPGINKFLIQMREMTYDLTESLFLNQIYLNVLNNKDMFLLFHKRLMDSLQKIDLAHTFSFLQHVFTYNTVLFNCISENQLVRLIISFYKGMLKPELTFNILDHFYDSIFDEEINLYVIDEIKILDLKKPKFTKRILEIEIRNFTFINEFKDYFIRNKDSFDALTIGLNELKIMKDFIKTENQAIEFIEIYLVLFSNLKSEFIENLINPILNCIIQALTMILNQTKLDQNFIDFNIKNWNLLSDLVLLTQKYDLEDQSAKKKGL